MFTGGDQLRLTSILGGTEFHKLLIKKYQESNFVISGTSAGAAACSNNMIYQGSSSEALLKGEVKITGGLGLINDVIIETSELSDYAATVKIDYTITDGVFSENEIITINL